MLFSWYSENHILEDVNKSVLALQARDGDLFLQTAYAIRGRTMRVCDIVSAEMDNYVPGIYTERVLGAVDVIKSEGLHTII